MEAWIAQVADEHQPRPGLLAPEGDCPPPERIDQEPGQRIEKLCALLLP